MRQQRPIEVLDPVGTIRPWPVKARARGTPRGVVRYEGVPARGLLLGVVLGAGLWLAIAEVVLAIVR